MFRLSTVARLSVRSSRVFEDLYLSHFQRKEKKRTFKSDDQAFMEAKKERRKKKI
jgi:hypothetical protein